MVNNQIVVHHVIKQVNILANHNVLNNYGILSKNYYCVKKTIAFGLQTRIESRVLQFKIESVYLTFTLSFKGSKMHLKTNSYKALIPFDP